MWMFLLATIAQADDEALLRALSVRDPVPSCSELAVLVPDPAVSLRNIAETVTLPPWAPMRAARCLVADHAKVSEPAFIAWVANPATAGLARLVLKRTAALEETAAARVIAAALPTSLRDDARAAIIADPRPALQALVQP
jgi:hypothetical protein